MAARKKYLFHPDEARKKIQGSMLLNRLQDHVNAPPPGVMDKSQVSAALGLLKKVLPDLTSTELIGNADKPIEHKLKIEFVRPGE